MMYRNHCTFTLGLDDQNEMSLGFLNGGQVQLTPSSPILHPLMIEVAKCLSHLLNQVNIECSEGGDWGNSSVLDFVQNVGVRYSDRTKQMLIYFVLRGAAHPIQNKIKASVRELFSSWK